MTFSAVAFAIVSTFAKWPGKSQTPTQGSPEWSANPNLPLRAHPVLTDNLLLMHEKCG
jgi:hypothetical protein